MSEQYRKCVGMVLVNREALVFSGRRLSQRKGWQFPQGGIKRGETEEEALFRELGEETGLEAGDVELLGQSRGWYSYRIPSNLRNNSKFPSAIVGQRQRWFLLRLTSDDSRIDINFSGVPEFSKWRWIRAEEAIEGVVHFKREIYRAVIGEFSAVVDFAGRPVEALPQGL